MGGGSVPDEEAGELPKPFLTFLPSFFGLVASVGSTRHLIVGIKPQEGLVPGFGQLLALAQCSQSPSNCSHLSTLHCLVSWRLHLPQT